MATLLRNGTPLDPIPDKKKKAAGGGIPVALVELTVVETATSSMRTKRSTN